MEINFLGKWSSNLVTGQRNVSFLLDDKIVFDFGPHSLESLLDRNLDPNNIETLLISHMHLDHYAGLAELLWYRSIYKAKNRLTVIGPKGIRRNTDLLLKLLNTPAPWYGEQITPNTEYIEDVNTDFVRVFRASHTIPCNAYRVEYGGKTIFYSGDTSYSEEIAEGAIGVDWLLHETTYTDKDREPANFWGHSTWSDAMEVFKKSGARHFVPVHLTQSSSELVLSMVGKVEGLVYPPDTLKL